MNFRTFDLNLLRVLDALLETRSTTAAGQQIGLSQPAVSAALARLRTALDDPLFLRQGRAMVPTDFALGLQAPLRDTLDRLEHLLCETAPFDPARAQASFLISGSDYFSEMLMPGLGERLSVMAPGIRVRQVDLVPDNYVETLARYDVDIALIPATELPDWAEQQSLMFSTFHVIARRGHPRLARAGLSPGEVIPIDLFCDLAHVIFSPEGNLQAMGDAALARVGRTRHVAMTLPSFAGVYNTVAGSDMIGLLPCSLAESVAARQGLAIYKAPIPLPMVEIVMVWHRRASRTPAHRWLRGQIAEVLHEAVSRVSSIDRAVIPASKASGDAK